MLLQPVFGALSDRIGRRNNMLLFQRTRDAGFGSSAECLDRSGIEPLHCVHSRLAALVIASFYTSISGVVKAELFPAQVRALGVGFTYASATRCSAARPNTWRCRSSRQGRRSGLPGTSPGWSPLRSPPLSSCPTRASMDISRAPDTSSAERVPRAWLAAIRVEFGVSDMTKGSDLLVAALENEGVDRIFGIPGEENL